ncbi:KTSC domain-containing protein [uncultured Phenylobacterium sp.]
MPSHVIRSFEYDGEAARLDVQLVSGRGYRYHEVPP